VKNLGTGRVAKRTGHQAGRMARSRAHPRYRQAGHPEVDGALAMPGLALNPGDKATKHFRIYSGPREYRRLLLLDNKERTSSTTAPSSAFPPALQPHAAELDERHLRADRQLPARHRAAHHLREGPALAAAKQANRT